MARTSTADGYPRGVWVDADGTLHFDTVELCVGAGVPPTAANQTVLEVEIRRQAAAIDADVTVREPEGAS